MLPNSSLSIAGNQLRSLLAEIDDLDAGQITIGHPSYTLAKHVADQNYLNLFFYHVQVDGYPADGAANSPYYLRLYCLITAAGGGGTDPSLAGENDLRLIGEVMRLMHQNPLISIAGNNTEPVAILQVVPHVLNLDNLNHIWSTQGDTAYRLSVAYEMALAPVPLAVPVEHGPRVGATAVRAEGNLLPDPLPPGGFDVVAVPPRVQPRHLHTRNRDWLPHICFVHANECTYALAFEVGSAELAAFAANTWLVSAESAILELTWEQWRSDSGWTVVSRRPLHIDTIVVAHQPSATLFAGSGLGGIQRSTDWGLSWQSVNTGIGMLAVTALTIDPSTPTTFYAGTDGGGIFRSTDNGDNWMAVNTGLGNLAITALVIDQANPAILYAGCAGQGVYRSADSGATWVAKNTAIETSDVRCLALEPSLPGTVYVGTRTGGVFKSDDSADSWSPSSQGLTEAEIVRLLVDPLSAGRLFAISGSGGLYRSADAGATWAPPGRGLGEHRLETLWLDPATPDSIRAYARGGVGFTSADGGDTWQTDAAIAGGHDIRFFHRDAQSNEIAVGRAGHLLSRGAIDQPWQVSGKIPTGLNRDNLAFDPDHAARAETLALQLPDKTTAGQYLLYLQRHFETASGQPASVRSNPLLVSLYGGGA